MEDAATICDIIYCKNIDYLSRILPNYTLELVSTEQCMEFTTWAIFGNHSDSEERELVNTYNICGGNGEKHVMKVHYLKKARRILDMWADW